MFDAMIGRGAMTGPPATVSARTARIRVTVARVAAMVVAAVSGAIPAAAEPTPWPERAAVAEPAPVGEPAGDGAVLGGGPVADLALAGERGGFLFGNGVILGFSVEALTEINGVMTDRWRLETDGRSGSPGAFGGMIDAGVGGAATADSLRNLAGLMDLVTNTHDGAVIRHMMEVRVDMALSSVLRSRFDSGLAAALSALPVR